MINKVITTALTVFLIISALFMAGGLRIAGTMISSMTGLNELAVKTEYLQMHYYPNQYHLIMIAVLCLSFITTMAEENCTIGEMKAIGFPHKAIKYSIDINYSSGNRGIFLWHPEIFKPDLKVYSMRKGR